MTAGRAAWGIGLAILCCSALAAQGCGDGSESSKRDRGDMTTRAAVVSTLEASGYKLRYRRLARTRGYDAVAGQASDRTGGHIAFSVVVRNHGPYRGSGDLVEGGSPQLPIVPYADEGATTTIGNVIYTVQPLSPYVIGPVEGVGRDWVPRRNENRMAIRIGSSLRRLFAPQFRGL
jgi:hypothetical protein